MSRTRSLRWTAAAVSAAFLSMGVYSCDQFGMGSPFMFFRAPLFGQLSLPEGVDLDLHLSRLVDRDSLVVELDGAPLDPAALASAHGGPPAGLEGTLPDLDAGRHVLAAHAELRIVFWSVPIHAATAFDVADLERPDECEILNNAECYLPFPSSRFLEEVGDETETGFRANFPEWKIEGLVEPNPPLDPTPFDIYDGYAPTTQVLVHLRGADPEVSGASRLLPAGVPQSPPFVGVRTYDERSLDADSPTLLIDADTGERVLHWVETDVHATGNPDRQVLFLRPAQALVPGHRYIVAFRRMLDSDGNPVPPEDTFRVLRDRLPSTIPALEARRPHFERLFHELWRAGVQRHDLQLAFDFVVRSEKQLHEQMLTMRDDALGWLGGRAPDDVSGFDNVAVTSYGDCSDPAQPIWRKVTGTFDGPYYMDGDINDVLQVVFLKSDADNLPVRNGEFPFNWSIAVPCSVFRGEDAGHPLLLGHGFLGDGAGMVNAFVAGGLLGGGGDVAYVAGATDWRGLALGFTGPDAVSLVLNVIGLPSTGHRFNNFAALPHRLMQGMVNTLVLSRMMKSGFFNRLPEFQRVPGDASTGVMPVDEEMFYFGVSLGGIMGTFYAGLNQDVIRHNIDVPAMNFSILEQRSTQFPAFLQIIRQLGLTDPMDLVLLLQLQHEIWVSADPAAYVRNITGEVDPPLPNTPPKKLLMTVAWLDKQVSNQAAEIMARSLGIPNLVGSVQAGLAEIPDVDAGSEGLDSALVIYHVGDLDIYDPAHQPFLPPLANDIPSSVCDPHGARRLAIPASIEQLEAFLRPGGKIFNFCDGVCDGASPQDRPPQACDPLAP
jgi:hypothetical protein